MNKVRELFKGKVYDDERILILELIMIMIKVIKIFVINKVN